MKFRCDTSKTTREFRLFAETLDEPVQTITNTEHLPIVELRYITFPRDGVPTLHHHKRTEEVENSGKQNGIDNNVGRGVFNLNTRHEITFFLFLFSLDVISIL